jgi:peptidase E
MRGRVLFNGNMGSPGTFLRRVRSLMLGSARGRTPKVLVVTAAWGQGERNDGAIREALDEIGLQDVTNLGAWHAWRDYLQARPQVASVDRELREVEEATRQFYVEKTSFHAERIRRAVRFAQSHLDDFRLGALPLSDRDPLRDEASLSGRELLARAVTRELVHDLEDLVQNDARMLQALDDAERMLPARTGLRFDPLWQREQKILADRVLEADALLLLGGDPGELLAPLRFFDLRPALAETLRRGATFFSISAGSLVLCERMVIYDDFSSDPSRREFRLFDRGLGLVGGLQVLPHCMDRIHTDDPDNLAYLARRFSTHVCVGLNEESFLLVEPGEARARSVGEKDGVYVFGPDGLKWRYHQGELIPLG